MDFDNFYAGYSIAWLIKVAIKEGESFAVSTDDFVPNYELFLTRFYSNAFGINLSLKNCHNDFTEVEAIITVALEFVADPSDIMQWIEAVTRMAEYKEVFASTFEDCQETVADLNKGYLLFKPLINTKTAKKAAIKARILHPLAFPLNMKKALVSMIANDWAEMGHYSGKDVHFMIDGL